MSTTNLLSKLIVIIFLFGFASSCNKQLVALQASEDQLKTDMAMYEKVWDEVLNEGKINQLNSDHFQSNIVMIAQPENVVGIEDFKAYYQQFLTGFSDIEFSINDIFGDGDKMVKHWNFKGKHTGSFFGMPATNRSVDMSGVTLVKMKDGKIAQEQDFMDNMAFMQQLGVFSDPANVSVIDGLYKAFAKGDIPAALAPMDANIVWNEAENFPYADRNPYKGPEAVVNGVFARIGAEWEYWNLTGIELHDMSNNQVLATLRYNAKYKKNDAVIDAQTAHLWTLKDGKIIGFQQFTDTKQVADAVSAGSFPMIMTDNYYLPVSTKSDIAKAAYYKAAQMGSNVRISKMMTVLDEAISEDPNFFMAHALKIYYSSDDKKAAAIDKALAVDTKHLNEAEKIVRKQFVLWDKDPKAKIADNMKALVNAYPNTLQAYHWAALHATHTDKDDDSSIKYAQQLIALNPEFGPIYNTTGYIYLDRKEMMKARTAFEDYIAYSAMEANPYDSMGDYYMANKEYKKAAVFYEKAAVMGMPSAKERAVEAREEMVMSSKK